MAGGAFVMNGLLAPGIVTQLAGLLMSSDLCSVPVGGSQVTVMTPPLLLMESSGPSGNGSTTTIDKSSAISRSELVAPVWNTATAITLSPRPKPVAGTKNGPCIVDVGSCAPTRVRVAAESTPGFTFWRKPSWPHLKY